MTNTDAPTIYLWDIDGTLITSGGAGRRAIVRTFERLFDEPEPCRFSFGGMTDRLIVRQGLAELGIEPTEARIDAVLADYLEHLADEVGRAEGYAVHPGVVEALEATRARGRCAIGLGTGNVERGGRIKLERVGLNPWFGFGGFGCDAEDRTELLRAGARRGAERLGRDLERCRVVIIGDTPRDIEAARGIGARCVAVATGGATREDLEAAGPDHLFDDLSVPGALEALLDA